VPYRPRLLPALLLCAAFLLGLTPRSGASAAPSANADGRPEQVTLSPPPPANGPQLAGAGYLSPITAAKPFTHMLLRWRADEPAEDTIQIEARGSLDGNSWTGWGAVGEDHDLWQPSDGADTHWSQAIYAGAGARFWQLRASFSPAADGRLPSLREIQVSTVDARFGPASPAATPSLSSQGKPGVVSRTAWGSPDGQSSRAAPVYYPVNHMVVHHTADANSLTGSEQSWADRVRAEWSFHTYTRGWGDVGYNYLIDPNGVIYEGRAGGDDAVAFHDTANYGSMGVVLIGTYSQTNPQTATLDSLVALLAWKAEQKRIDPLGRSYYYGCARSTYCAPYNPGAIVENIAGHRQVTPGHTSCPGDSALGELPSVRQRVQARINGASTPAPDDGDLTVDELESGFARSAATWYDAACGYGGHSLYTYATDSMAESSNSASWTPNLPEAGSYRVLAHIPQGCGVNPITAQARYRVQADKAYDVTVNQNTSDEWVSLGVFSFAAGRAGSVRLSDLTGEPYSQRRAVLFDSVRWVREEPSAQQIELLNVQYDRDTVAAGELLKVSFTVRNSGSATIESQAPEAGTRSDLAASFDSANSYVYDEGECFLGADGQDYPVYPKEAGSFRLMLGPAEADRAPTCASDSGGYPWRWGLNGPLAPGETREVLGYLRFRVPGSVTLRAGAIQEYVGYAARDSFSKTITVTNEGLAPAPISYDAALNPLAYVYRMGGLPDNLLARTENPLSVVKGALVGSFAWEGDMRDWGAGGPLPGLSDGFIVEQTRVFVAPTTGAYDFQTTSDDGSWLWVDGAAVVVNAGLHEAGSITGTVSLEAGRHVLSFKYFERSGSAVAGYSLRAPGASDFGQPIEGLGGRDTTVDSRLGAIFPQLHGITVAADDQGGSGVTKLQVSFDNVQWLDVAGSVFTLSSLVDGSYTLRYRAVDAAGNQSATQSLSFQVDSALRPERLFLPLVAR
jgi:hypothetical protein